MRILLDESLPRELGLALVGHAVRTVAQVGWSGLKNGELLRKASVDFDVFMTADQNLEYQQNLIGVGIAIAVLVAKSNRIEDLSPLVPEVLAGLPQIAPGAVLRIGG